VSVNDQWLDKGHSILYHGKEVEPRGKRTYELPHQTVKVPMRQPVLTIPGRQLSYQFMAAEAYWILTGDRHVATIAPYNKYISQFSDDGETFAGAYGPRIMEQLDYVVGKLIEDPMSRQAVLTIWTPNPGPSKDIPCTVAIGFQVRDGKLNCHVFMRSSDLWLGLPYDLFNFSMLGHLVCCRLRQSLLHQLLEPGDLYLTAASLHLYEEHRLKLFDIINDGPDGPEDQPLTPETLFQDEFTLLHTLRELRNSRVSDRLRWWL
jgi:thymidylate synthase